MLDKTASQAPQSSTMASGQATLKRCLDAMHAVYSEKGSEHRDYDTESLSECSSDGESVNHEAENAIARALMIAAFNKSLPPKTLQCLLQHPEPVAKKPRVSPSTQHGSRMRVVLSAPALSTVASPKETVESPRPTVKPDDCLRALLSKEGMTYKVVASSELESFFLPVTPESINGYDIDMALAVRNGDIEHLRRRLEAGENLQCGNKFGESIVHTACRRGNVDMLKFLLHEAKLSARVCCDYGRTPLHDACWTAEPSFEIVDILLEACPDFLYMTDKRGFTPLAYVRREHWPTWNAYLKKKERRALGAKDIR